MKNRIAIMSMATVFLIGASLMAQDSSMSTAPAADKAASPKEHSMTGCLQKGTEANTFQLTGLEKGPKTVEIPETTAKLDPHVGHKVEITGTATTGKDPKAHTMKITGVKMLSSTCP